MAKGKSEPAYPDGPYREGEITNILYDRCDFTSEAEFESHVATLLPMLLDEPLEIQQQVSFPPNQPRKRAKFRFDIVAKGTSHYIVECKAPSGNAVTSLVAGVAQLQLYGTMYERLCGIKPKLILMAPKINQFLTDYMNEHAKGVALYVVGKNYHARMDCGA